MPNLDEASIEYGSEFNEFVRDGQFANASTSMSSNNCSQDDFKRLLTALEAYFLSKEGRIPSEFAGILGRDTQATNVESQPDTLTLARSSDNA
ncbi:hypothetical protein PIB30_048856 [Stylosanthes scabra]|uniref:Uncharacterized protein n=1 Tax=Stylosanthes scabra TaxID=79078 RepID=A0ABU6XG80_9FABA|nr:hypothetical protein [Stylosanthes scabra]